MGAEASKTRAIWQDDVLSLMQGEGIDIGCGPDPIFPQVDRFDLEQGDANEISRFVDKQYDFVFSSHCLEHMEDPGRALREWYSILKPGGHLVVLVPDEDLYEQGFFPSRFNADHKHTFTISKQRSWSPRSVNVLDLVRDLDAEVVRVEVQDHQYDRRLLRHRPPGWALFLGRILRRLLRTRPLGVSDEFWTRLFAGLGAAVDQTTLPGNRLAQIQFILRKPA